MMSARRVSETKCGLLHVQLCKQQWRELTWFCQWDFVNYQNLSITKTVSGNVEGIGDTVGSCIQKSAIRDMCRFLIRKILLFCKHSANRILEAVDL